jgi:hypothetical protein
MTFLGVVAVFSVGCAVISHQTQHESPAGNSSAGEVASPSGEPAETPVLPQPVEDLYPDDPRPKYQFLPGVQIAADEVGKKTFRSNVMIYADSTREGNRNWPEQIRAETVRLLPVGSLKISGRWTIKDNATNWISSWRDDSVAYIAPDGTVRVQGPARHMTPSVLAREN